MKTRFYGYWKRARFEYSQWRWRQYFARCRLAFDDWQRRFTRSNAQVLLGTHFHQTGGVRNHLLAIEKYSKLQVQLVPEESDLKRYGPAPINENMEQFLQTPPPPSALAVHTHVLPPLIDWAQIHAAGKLKWIHTHHLFYYPEAGREGIEPWQQQLNLSMLHGARNCDTCLCVSRWEQAVLEKKHGIKAQYIPNGVDVVRCELANANRFRKRFRIVGDFALWVGRLDPVKNPKAFVEIAAKLPHLQFVMVGGVSKEDILREYSLQTPKNLRLLAHLKHMDVLDAIAACRSLVVTSFKEGLPTLVLEGMTMGRAIVIPNEAGCLDATDGESCATVYNLDSIDDLKEKVLYTMSFPVTNDNGRRRVLAEFDWRVVAAKLDRIYQGTA
jgi:glycosyltransferase involved in cell wall biosynthesis